MLHSQYLLELHGIVLGLLAVMYYFLLQKNKSRESNLIAIVILINDAVLFWDMMAYSQQGVATNYGFTMHVVANFFLYSLEYLEVVLMAVYIFWILKKYTGVEYRKIPEVAVLIASVLFLLLICNLFTGWYYSFDADNYYHRGPLFFASMVPQMLMMIVCLVIMIREKRHLPVRLFRVLMVFFLIPIVGVILQMLFFGFSFFNVGTMVSVVLFLWNSMYQINEDQKKREEILFQTQTCLLGTQMNPHFVFNALSAIGFLMDEDVTMAHEALINFSNFLRKSLEINPESGLATLENELECAKAYISIEKLRFGEMLDVIFDIQDRNVLLPFLTIEPLVENAIKHGIRKRSGKGTVVVTVFKEEDTHVITVKDDGIGFNEDELEPAKESRGIGLRNVKERVRILCEGTVKVTSRVGYGTTVEIRIPEVKNETVSRG